ncbi:hypothetical protein CHLNCDRAFT_12983, partial [Chlorella variabilis]
LAQGQDVDAADHVGCTGLHFAAMKGDCEVAQLLLQHRADVNTGDSTGATPLIGAVIKQHQDMVRLLLAAGA